jgi:hypothetical protein
MKTITARKPPRRVTIVCSECGDMEQINDRSYRRKIAEGRPHICRLCRQVRAVVPTETHRNYWRTRYSQQEIVEMANAIWG